MKTDSEPVFKAQLWKVLGSVGDAWRELWNEEEALGINFFPNSEDV